MFSRHAIRNLSAYHDGQLSREQARAAEAHLAACERCRKALEEIRFAAGLAQAVRPEAAPAGLWGEIERALETPRALRPLCWLPAAAALALVAAAVVWFAPRPERSGQKLVRLKAGQWLETGRAARAKIDVGSIGEVEVGPNTRIRLVRARETEYRLALARGEMSAKIWAPPRLFFVETPSALAVDLGCAYTMQVDDHGFGLLRVTTGWVLLEEKGRESMVPGGAVCRTRPGAGPGTPYFEDASDGFRRSLARFDFAGGGEASLAPVLRDARPRDTLTLWHLLSRVSAAGRERVYGRLAALSPPPSGVTREKVLALDAQTLELWKRELEWIW